MTGILRWFVMMFAALLPCPGWSEAATDWLAFGDLRGYLETCGCDPKTDLGGVARIALLLQREKAHNASTVVFDLGNNFDLPAEPDLKAKYIGTALSRLPVDAALYNRIEAVYPEFLLNKRPWVLSNVSGKRPELIKEFREAGNVLIFGYVWHPELAGRVKVWDSAIKNNIAKVLKSRSGKTKILLFSGPDDHLSMIIASKLFDRIISSNTAGSAVQPGFKEMENPELLNRKFRNTTVRMVPLGGVGVLRGGRLRQKEAPSLDELLRPSRKSPLETKSGLVMQAFSGGKGAAPSGLLFRDIPVTWLTPSYEGGSPLSELMEAYEAEARGAFARMAGKRVHDLASTPFAGADACKLCHRSAWDVWSKSKHAHALDTLKMQEKNHDPECVGCHVLGWEEKGGFVSEKDSPHFAGVQCETCHGAAKAHTADPVAIKPLKKREVPEVCITCHHTPHSPSFQFEGYWNKIKHTK